MLPSSAGNIAMLPSSAGNIAVVLYSHNQVSICSRSSTYTCVDREAGTDGCLHDGREYCNDNKDLLTKRVVDAVCSSAGNIAGSHICERVTLPWSYIPALTSVLSICDRDPALHACD